jgi:hypothetical protein
VGRNLPAVDAALLICPYLAPPVNSAPEVIQHLDEIQNYAEAHEPWAHHLLDLRGQNKPDNTFAEHLDEFGRRCRPITAGAGAEPGDRRSRPAPCSQADRRFLTVPEHAKEASMPPLPAPSPAGASIVSPAQFRVLQRARARMLHPAGGKGKQMEVNNLFTPAIPCPTAQVVTRGHAPPWA